MKTAGQIIKLFIHEHSISRAQLSEATELSATTISAAISGKGSFSINTAYQIGKLFDSINKTDKPWSQVLMLASLDSAASVRMAELAEYTKQQEQNK